MDWDQLFQDATFDSDSRVRKAAKKIIATHIFDHGFSVHLRAMSTTKALWANAKKRTDVLVGQCRAIGRIAQQIAAK